MTVALVDYGAGNLNSVRKAFVHLGADVMTPERPEDLDKAAAIIVPGVGNFRATAALGPAWRARILASVHDGRPLLGICLGLQWLFEGSTEAPDVPGLGLFPGVCRRLDEEDRTGHSSSRTTRAAPGTSHPAPRTLKIPHVGWNALHIVRPSWLLAGLSEGAQVYFTHSYAAPIGAECVATTTYGTAFAAVAEQDGFGGVQFHPEKSGEVGLMVLRTFLKSVSK